MGEPGGGTLGGKISGEGPRHSGTFLHTTSRRASCMSPKSIHGKVCYLEIPAVDVDRSAAFYSRIFGWQTRRRGDGALAFDDAVGGVSGSVVAGGSSSPTARPLRFVTGRTAP